VQAQHVTAVVKQFQRFRRQIPSAPLQADLNIAVSASLEELMREATRIPGIPLIEVVDDLKGSPGSSSEAGGVLVYVKLAPQQALVPADASDLTRLCKFLIRSAAAAAFSVGGPVWVRVELQTDKVTLWVEDGGPSIPAELLPEFFEVASSAREGQSSLELAACKTLVKRLQGTIEAKGRSTAGIAMHVDLPRPPRT